MENKINEINDNCLSIIKPAKSSWWLCWCSEMTWGTQFYGNNRLASDGKFEVKAANRKEEYYGLITCKR